MQFLHFIILKIIMFRIVARNPNNGDIFVGSPCLDFAIQTQTFLLDAHPEADTFKHGGISVQVFPGGDGGPWFDYNTWVKAEIIMTKARALTTEQWARPNFTEWAAISTTELDLIINTNKEYEAIRYLTDGQPVLSEIKGGADQRTWAGFNMGRLTVKARICLQGPIPPSLFPDSVRNMWPQARSAASILHYLVRQDKLMRTGAHNCTSLETVIDQSHAPGMPTRRIYQESRPALVRVDTDAPASSQAGPSGVSNTGPGTSAARPATPTMDELPDTAANSRVVDAVRLENEGGSSHRVRKDTPHPSQGIRISGLYTRQYGRDMDNLRVVVPNTSAIPDPTNIQDPAILGVIPSKPSTMTSGQLAAAQAPAVFAPTVASSHYAAAQRLASHGTVNVSIAKQNYGNQQVFAYSAPPVDYRQQAAPGNTQQAVPFINQQSEQELYANLPPPVPAFSANPYRPNCPGTAQAAFRARFANATAASRPGKPPSTLLTMPTPKSRKKSVSQKKVRFTPTTTSSPKGQAKARKTPAAAPTDPAVPPKKTKRDRQAETDSDDSDRT